MTPFFIWNSDIPQVPENEEFNSENCKEELFQIYVVAQNVDSNDLEQSAMMRK